MKSIKAPGHLSAAAKRLYKQIVDDYGLHDDAAALKYLQSGAELWDRATACRKQIEKEGLTFLDRFGQQRPHPLLVVERDARAGFLQAMKSLNLDIEPLRDGPGRPPGR